MCVGCESELKRSIFLSNGASRVAAGKMFLFGEAHYPVALDYLSLSLGPDGRGNEEISFLYSFAQLSCLSTLLKFNLTFS